MTFNLKLSLNLLAAGFSLTYLAAPTQAACVSGDCSALGYNKSESACSGDIIRCPFDTSKVFCKENKIEIGDILYSDMTTSHSFNIISGKTPIGVVFDTEKRKALALSEFGNLAWSTTHFDIPSLPDIGYMSDPSIDSDGKSNTKKIIDYCRGNSKSCPAAEKAYSYSTTGTKAGQWYLPAAGEMDIIANNSGKLNDTIFLLRGSQLFTAPSDGYYTVYWTSSESYHSQSGNTIYGSSVCTNSRSKKANNAESKTRTGYTIGGFPMTVRPVITF